MIQLLMKIRTSLYFCLLSLAAMPAFAGEQQCDGPSARPASDFMPLGDGSQLLDKRSKLVWMRCIEDQTWTGTTCQANDHEAVNPGPRLTYAQALAYAVQHSTATEKWRLPTYRELAALREPNCYNPSMNLALFPTVPAWSSDGAFWTQTKQSQGRALVDAIGKSDSWAQTDTEHTNHVRLVRDASDAEKQLLK